MKKNNPVKSAKKKISPSKESLLSRQKKDKKTIKNKIAFKAFPTKRVARPQNEISAEKYRDIIENIQEGFFELDLAGNFTFLNNSVCLALGYTREKLIGINSRQFTDKNDSKKIFQSYNKVYKTCKPIKELGWHITRKNGEKRYIEGSIYLRKDSSGKPIGFRVIAYDFTERKRMEETLRHNEEKYRSILENMQEGYFEIDLNGNFTFFNDSLCRIDGYSKDELMGMNYRQYTDKETAIKVFQAFNRVYKTGEFLPEINLQITRKDGTNRYTEASVSLLKDSSGKPIGFRGILRDVTDRKRTEDKLREEEQRFKALAEQSSEVIVLVNREGIVTYENPAIEKALGFKPEERIGVSAFNLIHPDDLKIVNNAFHTLFNDKNATVQKAEIRIRHKDGGWRTFETVAGNLIYNNIIEFAIVNLHDITERKKTEHALQESKHRYRALSMIDDLTQLYNSRHFYAQLKKEIQRSNRYGQNLTLLLLDIDKFKVFNDAYGHVEGDIALSRLGKAIKRCLREIDSAYRYGGEEFTIILPMTTNEEGIVIAQRIQNELSKETFAPVPDHKVYLTVSIGLSQYKSNEDVKAFVRRADQLMYKVKKTERGKICSDNGDMR